LSQNELVGKGDEVEAALSGHTFQACCQSHFLFVPPLDVFAPRNVEHQALLISRGTGIGSYFAAQPLWDVPDFGKRNIANLEPKANAFVPFRVVAPHYGAVEGLAEANYPVKTRRLNDGRMESIPLHSVAKFNRAVLERVI